MSQKQGLLDVLLNDLALTLLTAANSLEFLNAIIDAVNAEASGVVARFDNPNVSSSVQGVLGQGLLQPLVVLEHAVDQQQRRPLPAAEEVSLIVALQRHLLRARPDCGWQRREVFDRELGLRVAEELVPNLLVVKLV